MPDRNRPREGGKITGPKGPQKEPSQRKHSSRTAGTNRDLDESGESVNQGHGHPRGERDAERRD